MKRLCPRAAAIAVLGLCAQFAWLTGAPSNVQAAQPLAGAIDPVQPPPISPAMSPAPRVANPGGPEGVAPTPIPGMVEVRRGADVVYMSRDGKYVIAGDLYRVASHEDLTEVRRRELRRKLIDAIPESEMVVFGPEHPKYTVTVFTDIDCEYCRALHSQIADYNRLGIRVRYVFFPRTGPNTPSWFKAEQVWCSADRRRALTRAKLGESLTAKACAATPVAREYALAQAMGLEGTPGIVAENGALVGGYLPPSALKTALQDSTRPPLAQQINN